MAPPLITDPTGDADRQTEIQIGFELSLACREAVGHALGKYRAVLTQDADEILVCIALVQEQRFAGFNRKRQLCSERTALALMRGKIAVIVQSAFAHSHDRRRAQQLAQLRECLGREAVGMMGMNAGGGEY